MRCDVTDVAALEKLLCLFFAYECPEIAGFRRAVELCCTCGSGAPATNQ
jgi:hypothetical protein